MIRREEKQHTGQSRMVRHGSPGQRKPMMAVPRGDRSKATKQPAEPNPFLEAALEYARRGWAVFPLGARSKSPLKGSNGLNDAATNPNTIRRWWAEWPDANVGIRTGEVSDLVVVDIDPRSQGNATWDYLIAQYSPISATAEVFTSRGGRHLYFRHAFMAAKGILGPGIDIKSDGGYVVAPPSIHPNGQPYEWEARGEGPTELPDWLVTYTVPVDDKARASAFGALALAHGVDKTTKQRGTHHPTKKTHRSSTAPVGVRAVGGGLQSLEADVAMAKALELPVRPDGSSSKFSCILPGHGVDREPSAALFVGQGGDVLYQCFQGGRKVTLTLPRVRASLAYGKVVQLKDSAGRGLNGEHMAWRLRLLCEARVLAPLPVAHRELPSMVRPAIKAVYDGFILLLGLKEHIWPGDGTAYGRQFAAAWSDVSEQQARDASKWLMKEGYFHVTDTYHGRGGKEGNVLRPVVPLDDVSFTGLWPF